MLTLNFKGFEISFEHVETPEPGYNYIVRLHGTTMAKGWAPGGRFHAIGVAYKRIEEEIRKANAKP